MALKVDIWFVSNLPTDANGNAARGNPNSFARNCRYGRRCDSFVAICLIPEDEFPATRNIEVGSPRGNARHGEIQTPHVPLDPVPSC